MIKPRVVLENVPQVAATLNRIAERVAETPPATIAELAGSIRLEAPVVTGWLQSTITGGSEGVMILAEYAAITNARNDYIGRGIAASEPAVRLAWETRIDEITAAEGAQ